MVVIGSDPDGMDCTVVDVRFAAIADGSTPEVREGSARESLGAVHAAIATNALTVVATAKVRLIDLFMDASGSPSSVGPPSGREGPAARCLCIGARIFRLEPGSQPVTQGPTRTRPVASRP